MSLVDGVCAAHSPPMRLETENRWSYPLMQTQWARFLCKPDRNVCLCVTQPYLGIPKYEVYMGSEWRSVLLVQLFIWNCFRHQITYRRTAWRSLLLNIFKPPDIELECEVLENSIIKYATFDIVVSFAALFLLSYPKSYMPARYHSASYQLTVHKQEIPRILFGN